MRVAESGCAAIIAAVGVLFSFSLGANADEPVKPTASASEANPAVPPPGHSLHSEAFNDGPRHAAHLIPGMGKVHFPVTTGKPEAQKFIDQGVAQLHSFYYFESERSFRQAAKIDPGCAMAYWGMAMSNINNPRRAKGFLKEARKRAAGIGSRESLYLAALESFQKDGANDRARRQGWLQGLESIVQDSPGDIDARAWLAMVTWQNSMDGIGSRQAVDVVLDTVLQVEPMHPGAHHYRIHLWDGHKPLRAEKSAALYAKTALGIAHAWHMPGHTYTELKRYGDAAYQQEGSARVDHAYMIRDRVMPFEIHNYAHNNQWLCTSLSHIGRARDAIAVARNLVEQPRDPAKNGPNDGGSAQRSGRSRWSEILTRYELWDDLIAATTTGALDWSNVPFELEQKAYTLGQAYAARNELDKLAPQIEALRKMTSPGAKSAQAELEGLQSMARGDVGPAFDSFAKATSMRPEALARAHLKARNFAFAEVKIREAVTRNPNQVAPLAAQVEILHACGKDNEAREAYRSLEPLARSADQDLPVFRRIAGIVDRWKADKTWAPSIATRTDETTLRTSRNAEHEKIQNEIKERRAELRKLVDIGTVAQKLHLNLKATKSDHDSSKPTFSSITEGQRERLAGEMIRNDLAIFKIESDLSAIRAARQMTEKDGEQQIRDEFRKDPEVIALMDEIAMAAEQRGHGARPGDDPARRAAEQNYKKLMDQYLKLWQYKYAEIRARLKTANIGDQSEESIHELEVKLKSLKEQKAKQTNLFTQMKGQEKAVDNDIFEATFINRQLEFLLKRADQLKGEEKSVNNDSVTTRIDLTTLGPLTWAPPPAEPFTRNDTTGAPWSLPDKKGKNVLLIFFLGGKCAHCMQQLQVFGKELDALKKLNVETVAIGTDDLEASRVLKNNKDGIKFSMPILADPKQDIFKLYQAYDDFEGQPLHGTILIDALGNVRFQRISADPFLEVEFIKTEAERVNGIVNRSISQKRGAEPRP